MYNRSIVVVDRFSQMILTNDPSFISWRFLFCLSLSVCVINYSSTPSIYEELNEKKKINR